MRHAADTLESLGVGPRAKSSRPTARRIVWRTMPKRRGAGTACIIAGAGGAAHLPGMTASMTPPPVFGVPIESNALNGRTARCPSSRCREARRWNALHRQGGAINAALISASVIALMDRDVAQALDDWRAEQTAAVAGEPSDDGRGNRE